MPPRRRCVGREGNEGREGAARGGGGLWSGRALVGTGSGRDGLWSGRAAIQHCGHGPTRLFPVQPMDTEAELQFRPRMGKAASAPLLPEVEAYLQLLLVIYLMNSKRYPEVRCPRMRLQT